MKVIPTIVQVVLQEVPDVDKEESEEPIAQVVLQQIPDVDKEGVEEHVISVDTDVDNEPTQAEEKKSDEPESAFAFIKEGSENVDLPESHTETHESTQDPVVTEEPEEKSSAFDFMKDEEHADQSQTPREEASAFDFMKEEESNVSHQE
jgi:hypothetical protein